ncbi:MAG: YihY/virulence factor BrkB family protein [Candidatus Abyssobacteria bacterium SURF_5]|uniref:YihY/virulence factor BrkB family protein n=1 Tax=Abyssobacteria bacterium (strain SURF_5) TaxID=2093360 RepID=A0A3A4N8A8_ABYX5|nr:MAG: YihY/virulence factor BrkB family protein [Candidatus Abyssubacteria bacterium SURF_5]
MKGVLTFLSEDIWRIPLKEQPARRSWWIKALRVIVLSVKGFDRDRCTLRASALTFYTLLSIVPIMAMAFGIAKGFGFDHILEERIREQLQEHEEVVSQIITFARNMLDNTKGGLVAGIGVIFLFWTIIKVLGNMERSFNEIWGIKKHRTMARKFSDYLSFMLVAPIMFIVAGSMTVAVTSRISDILTTHDYLAFVSGPVLLLLKILPFAVLWGLFAFIYMFLPNGKVNTRSALLAGILAGSVYQIVQWAYITFQIGINSYNAIYGSFAALPLFLIWLQMSWLILLYGAELSFAHQNVATYEFEQDCQKVSPAFRRLVTLAVAHLCVSDFRKGEPPPSAGEIADRLGTPVRMVNQAVYDLVQAGILSEVGGNETKDVVYQPALDIHSLSVREVINRLENIGIDALPLAKSEAVEKISASLDGSRDASTASVPKNVLLKDL